MSRTAAISDKAITQEVGGETVILDLGSEQYFSLDQVCLLYTSPSPRDATLSRMPSSA